MSQKKTKSVEGTSPPLEKEESEKMSVKVKMTERIKGSDSSLLPPPTVNISIDPNRARSVDAVSFAPVNERADMPASSASVSWSKKSWSKKSKSKKPKKNSAYKELDMLQERLSRARGCLEKVGLSLEASKGPSLLSIAKEVKDIAPVESEALVALMGSFEHFNEVARKSSENIKLNDHYAEMATLFDSIEKDAVFLLEFMEKPRSRFEEFVKNWRTELGRRRRGTLHERFDRIQTIAQEAFAHTEDQVMRERAILEAYHEFQMAIKISLLLIEKIKGTLKSEQEKSVEVLRTAQAQVEALADRTETTSIDKMEVEIGRDDALKKVEWWNRQYMGLETLGHHLSNSIAYGEIIKMRQQQVMEAKEHVWRHSASFLSTNAWVFTGLQTTLKSTLELNQSTKMIQAMSGVSEGSAQLLAKHGNQVQMNAIEAAFKTGLKADTVRQLVASIVDYKKKSHDLIHQLQQKSMLEEQKIQGIIQKGQQGIVETEADRASIPMIAGTDLGDVTEVNIASGESITAPLVWKSVLKWPENPEHVIALKQARGLVEKALQDRLDRNLLMFAEINKQEPFHVWALLEAGANPLARLGQKTGVELALQKKNLGLVELLLSFVDLEHLPKHQPDKVALARLALLLYPSAQHSVVEDASLLELFAQKVPLEWRQQHWELVANHLRSGLFKQYQASMEQIQEAWHWQPEPVVILELENPEDSVTLYMNSALWSDSFENQTLEESVLQPQSSVSGIESSASLAVSSDDASLRLSL